jgi:hypothetical protein
MNTRSSPVTDFDALLAKAQYFVDCKYTTHADARQKSMGLAYVEAERQDLAREIVNFTMGVLNSGSVRDEEHPDCVTDRECELYDALMGLASHATAFHDDYERWTQGGVTLEPIVSKALRLGNFAVTTANCGVEK